MDQASVNLEAVPTGVTEHGTVWTLPVLYNHFLLGGRTGSGKSGMLHAMIAGLGPAIKTGLAQLWVIDPKGGMELWPARRLFSRFEYQDAESFLLLMEETVCAMQERADRLREAGSRKHVPTPDEPLIVLIIDEAATLSAFAPRDIRNQFAELHGLLLSQGRAVGFSVIETVIDPSKDTVPQRQLFPYRIGLALNEKNQVAMILGDDAWDRGARCTKIPTNTPGVAYVYIDEKASVQRVRAFHVTDEDIARLVETYAPPAPVDAEIEAQDEPPEAPAAPW